MGSAGDVIYEKGFFTLALYVRGRSTSELESRLGFRAGRLEQGYTLLFATRLPAAGEFEMRGMTYMSGGVVMGHLKSPPDPRNAEQRLKGGGYNIDKLKQNALNIQFRMFGSRRLAKVKPKLAPFGESDYPVGSGVPQWELTSKIPWRIVAEVGPGGSYTGDYT